MKTLVTTCAPLTIALTAALGAAPESTAQSTDPVIQWNRNLLAIVRTPGAQAATIHPTRSFAIMHAAITCRGFHDAGMSDGTSTAAD